MLSTGVKKPSVRPIHTFSTICLMHALKQMLTATALRSHYKASCLMHSGSVEALVDHLLVSAAAGLAVLAQVVLPKSTSICVVARHDLCGGIKVEVLVRSWSIGGGTMVLWPSNRALWLARQCEGSPVA